MLIFRGVNLHVVAVKWCIHSRVKTPHKQLETNSWNEKTPRFQALENRHSVPTVQSEGPDIGSSPLDGTRTPS